MRAGAPCRSDGSPSRLGLLRKRLDRLREAHPGLVALDVHAVGLEHRLEHDRRAVALAADALELCDRLGIERSDPALEPLALDPEDDRDVTAGLPPRQEPVQGELEVGEAVHRQGQPGCDPPDDEMGDVVESPLARQGEDDLVGHSPSPSSSPRSRSRLAASSLPVRTASPKERRVVSVEAPCLTPAARPASFPIGRVTTWLTVRTAVSTVATASTALSVI